jgi:hypothetical protein
MTLNKCVEHLPDTAKCVEYPAEGSVRASYESGVASRDKTEKPKNG